jgi:archaellum component FlaG (FlaF/FlaG flagellin family)
MITGSVKNTGTETATYTRVYATVYDGPSGTGNVVAVTSTTAQPYNIDPGQTGTYQMGFVITSGKSYASMVIVAESD